VSVSRTGEGIGSESQAAHQLAQDFRIAGLLVSVADPPPALASYRVDPGGRRPIPVPAGEPASGEPSTRAVGWLGGRERQVECRAVAGGLLVSIESAGEYLVLDGGRSLAVRPPRPADHELYEEAILGPPLLLALAQRGTFCLHASSVARNGEAIAVLGDSGEGKSTLARWLSGRGDAWRRLTDDITPLSFHPPGARVLPAFPQLKVRERLDTSDASLPLRAWVRLVPSNGEPRLEAMRASERLVELSRGLAAARLFPAAIAESAFETCGNVAQHVPGYRLAYPHRREELGQVEALLASLLAKQPEGSPR